VPSAWDEQVGIYRVLVVAIYDLQVGIYRILFTIGPPPTGLFGFYFNGSAF
jgi:hypothetical protein